MNRIAVYSHSKGTCAAIQTEDGFLFHPCCDRNGFNPREFERSITAPGPKDLVVENRQILSRELRQLSPFETRLDEKWAMTFHLTEGRTKVFHISKKHGLQELKLFFGLHDDEIHLPEPTPARVERIERREKRDWLYILLYIFAFGLHFLAMVGLLFLPYGLWLAVGLTALLSPALLALCFPSWFTLTMDLAESRKRTGKELMPAWVLTFFPFYLMFAEPQLITYLSGTARVLLYLLPMLFLSAGVWFLSRERKTRPGRLALVLATWCFFGIGAGPSVNCADYYLRGPARTEQRRITELERRTNGSGTDRYYATAGSAGGDLTFVITADEYETLETGQAVIIDFYDGTLGVAYYDVYFP